MSASQDVRLNPVDFADWQLLPQRAIWWPLRSMLIVSDLHLGKAAHFRKHGIAIPNAVNADTLQRLDQLITQFKPRNVLVLGDLFHSEENEEWQEFRAWLMGLHAGGVVQSFRLVEGNHDILPPSAFEGLPMERCTSWTEGPFVFAHDPAELKGLGEGMVGVAGHLHPAVSMRGKGRQSLKLPCWWYHRNNGVLVVPTFGAFTGSVSVSPSKQDLCWVTTGEAVIAVPVS